MTKMMPLYFGCILHSVENCEKRASVLIVWCQIELKNRTALRFVELVKKWEEDNEADVITEVKVREITERNSGMQEPRFEDVSEYNFDNEGLYVPRSSDRTEKSWILYVLTLITSDAASGINRNSVLTLCKDCAYINSMQIMHHVHSRANYEC